MLYLLNNDLSLLSQVLVPDDIKHGVLHMFSIYYCFIYPYLAYSIEVWGLTFKIYLTKLRTLQKKIVRIVGLADRNAHTDPLFQEYKIMQLMKTHAYKVALAMY